MTVEKFLESLITLYVNVNIILHNEYDRVMAEYSFERFSNKRDATIEDLNNNFGECKIFNFYAEPHWSYDKTDIMIYHLFV